MSVYFDCIKPGLSRLGTLVIKITDLAIKVIEGIIVCQILIAVGTYVENEYITLVGKLALALIFLSIVIQIFKGINYFHYEIIKKRIFKHNISNFAYIVLYVTAFFLSPYLAEVFSFIVEFSEAVGSHIPFFVDGIDKFSPSSPQLIQELCIECTPDTIP